MNTEKKPSVAIAAGIALLVLVVTGSVVLYNNHTRIRELNAQNSDLNSTLRVRDSLVNSMASTFDEIEKNLTFVRDKQGQISLATSERSRDKKDIMVADIRLMNEMLQENSLKIEDLEKKLKSSGIEIKSFKIKIAQLNADILEQNNSISQLSAALEQRDTKIAEMNRQVVSLKNDNSAKEDSLNAKSQVIAAKEKAIEARDNDLNRVYYIAGTPKELKEKGIIQKEGGFLGLGRNTDLKTSVDKQYFSELDQRTAVRLPVFSK